jgi:hypothetical protein
VKRTRLAVIASAGALLAACSTSHHDVTPWFRVETTSYWQPPGFGGRSATQKLYVRRWGLLWRELEDARGIPVALDERTVLYGSSQGSRIIHEGETTSTPACPGERAGGPSRAYLPPATAFPPGGGRYDCFEVADGPAVAVATRIRMRRYDAAQALAFDRSVDVDAPDRTFARAMVSFYDDAGTAYFVALPRDYRVRSCTLLALDERGSRVVATRDDLALGTCSDAPRWTGENGRRLLPERWPGARVSSRGN